MIKILNANFEYNKKAIEGVKQHIVNMTIITTQGVLELHYNFIDRNGKIVRKKDIKLNGVLVSSYKLKLEDDVELERKYGIGTTLSILFSCYNVEEELKWIQSIGFSLDLNYKGLNLKNNMYDHYYHSDIDKLIINIEPAKKVPLLHKFLLSLPI